MDQDDTAQIICSLKELRQKKGYTQSELANMLGIKRQAVYDIESGRYLPNTLIALRLSRILNVTVEDIFKEKLSSTKEVELMEDAPVESRVSVVKVREKYIGYPIKNKDVISGEIQTADGLYKGGGKIHLIKREDIIDNTLALLGCDPAFNIVSTYITTSESSMHYRFASSKNALESLAQGRAHVAGTHMHSVNGSDANIEYAQKIMGSQKIGVVAFAEYEEGFIVAPGNPLNIKGVEDLTRSNVRFVNREPGAALRFFLEDMLLENKIPFSSVEGFDKCVYSHAEGAQLVEFGLADVALGLRSLAEIYNVGFVPLSSVNSDLIIPADLWDIRPVKMLIDALQIKRLRLELQSIAGYNTDNTGKIIKQP